MTQKDLITLENLTVEMEQIVKRMNQIIILKQRSNLNVIKLRCATEDEYFSVSEYNFITLLNNELKSLELKLNDLTKAYFDTKVR